MFGEMLTRAVRATAAAAPVALYSSLEKPNLIDDPTFVSEA